MIEQAIDSINRVIHSNSILKYIMILIGVFFNDIPYEYVMTILLVIVFLVMDIITGVIKARKFHSSRSGIFKSGAVSKITGHTFVIVAGYSLDRIIHLAPFINEGYILTVIFCIILIYGEITSIIENLSDIGCPISPIIYKVFQISKKKFYNNALKSLGPYNLIDYEEDINRLRMMNIRTIPPDYKLMYEYTIDGFDSALRSLFTLEHTDKDHFALQCEIVLKTTRLTTIDKIRKSGIAKLDKCRFMRGYDRQANKIEGYITSVYQDNKTDIHGMVSASYQYIIKSLYAGIADVLQKSKYNDLELTKEELSVFE